ncbi:MAG TPA: M56 family metallopeptidase, partial [Vicinamibacterales bacterium]
MTTRKIPARFVALSTSAAVHVVLLAAVLAFSPIRPDFAKRVRDSRGSSGQAQHSTSPGSALSKNAVTTGYSTPGTVAAPAASWALVPAVVARARRTEGDQILNHLWQSTLFAFLVGGLTLGFRKNDARVRYWMWFAAAVKFLVPFSFLGMAGASLLGPSVTVLFRLSATTPLSPVSAPFTIAQITQPFTATAITAAPATMPSSGGVEWTPIVLLIVWALGMEFVATQRFRAWRIVRAAVRGSEPIRLVTDSLPPQTEIRSSATVLEPAVVGMWRPILLLPAGIEQRLTSAELESVIAHEACHVTARDNLTAGVQMIIECLFWFHPAVWWIGGRLIHERERACDEHVLGVLQNPRVYADGIVNVCKHYVGAPLPCMPGVSSSDLRRRIERIMRNETGEAVSRPTRIALGIAASLVLIVPIVAGAVTATPDATPSQAPGRPSVQTTTRQLAFQAVSVKQNVSGSVFARVDVRSPGRLTAVNVPAALLIRFAYGLEEFEVVGGPAWLQSDHYDVTASAGADATLDQKRAMLQQVLRERFNLTTHNETRQLPTFALMTARSDGRLGPGLHRSATSCGSTGESALGPDAGGFGVGSGISLDT